MARAWCWIWVVGIVAGSWSAGAGEPEYEVGGPLAGVRLPLFPTEHGEAPGYPGCIPELMAQGAATEDMGREYREWGPQGQAPERLLYEGSVEHWRAYMFKYMPIRSFFDRQSQLKNFTAPNIPGADPGRAERYAEPVYWVPRHAAPRPTGRFRRPVAVVRMRVDDPVLRLDLGRLRPGVYVVRVIGAVPTEQLRPFRRPLYVRMEVNDGLEGETSRYRMRIGYCDQFYSVAEFYIQAPVERRYQARLAVDRGSTVDLLVRNVSLDDGLAGVARRAIKRRATGPDALPSSAAVRAASAESPMPAVERRARDAAIWRGFPPVNAQGGGVSPRQQAYGSIRGVTAGAAGMPGLEIEQRYGAWTAWDPRTSSLKLPAGLAPEDILLVNETLRLIYTLDDLRRGRPLPKPYPFPDDGAGLYFPNPDDPSAGAVWTPIGLRVEQLRRDYYNRIGRSLQLYRQHGRYDDAHDAALTLVRWAYAFPTLDYARYLTCAIHESGPYGRDYWCRRRATAAYFLPHYPLYVKPIMFWYDQLYNFIRDNQQLADSVSRFVPWVKTPEDVIELLDTHLVQTTAKRILRYHDHTDPMDIANLAAVAGDARLTEPWMEWLFQRTFIYPLPVAGIQDVMITGTTREGTEIVGSTYYAQDEGALRVAASLDRYLAAGGLPRFDLSDPERYPKPIAHAWWRLENVVAGWDFLRIGDVCGPDKRPGHTLRDLEFARHGWRWTNDPRFAFVVKHYLGRGQEDEGQWAEIERAAGSLRRAPWLDNRSRVLPMWAGVLESGLEHDDYRFRRAAYVRLGFGVGHHHDDSLDLQVAAHGLPMTIDGGQRPGYTTPGDRTTRAHNLVQVDGATAHRHSWAAALADCPGARYLAAEAAPPAGASLMRRQVALIDVDEGARSQPLPPDRQLPGAKLPEGVTTPNSYVVDVFRVAGGRRHTYCFHGPLNDQFQWNAANVGPPAKGSEEAAYLSRFSRMPELNLAGDCPQNLVAQWRMAREVEGTGGGEKEMLGVNFDPESPPKFTRLHVLGVAGARALRGEIVCQQWAYHFTNLMVRTPVAEQGRHSVLAAVIEPYVGRPFIEAARRMPVEPNEPDARGAAAVDVRLAGGRRDWILANGRPERVRRLAPGDVRADGEFVFLSTDQAGLRQAVLVGGRVLETPWLAIRAERGRWEGRVVRVDYKKRMMWIDQVWPASSRDRVLETGLPGHRTTYTASTIAPQGNETRIQLRRGADYFRSALTDVDSQTNVVATVLRPLVDSLDHNWKGWVASDDEATRFWRADYLGGNRFRLAGPPVSREAFGPAGVLRLWEYGPGDAVRRSAYVCVRRTRAGGYDVETDVPVRLSFPTGRSVRLPAADAPQHVPVR